MFVGVGFLFENRAFSVQFCSIFFIYHIFFSIEFHLANIDRVVSSVKEQVYLGHVLAFGNFTSPDRGVAVDA